MAAHKVNQGTMMPTIRFLLPRKELLHLIRLFCDEADEFQ